MLDASKHMKAFRTKLRLRIVLFALRNLNEPLKTVIVTYLTTALCIFQYVLVLVLLTYSFDSVCFSIFKYLILNEVCTI